MAAPSWERLLLRAATSERSASSIPVFLYGTAWKKERTADLVHQAICSGFTGVDTAAQPKHYREDLVGEGVRRALAEGKTKRENLYLQTKYTSVRGQDPDNMPFDPKASVTEQVHASIKSSLWNLRPSDEPGSENSTYLDALVLHSPLPTTAETLEAWRACEEYVPHKIRNLGISNCWLPVLTDLCASAKIQPAVVQNRFYNATAFDVAIREFCRNNDIVYQSFWTLTANPELARSEEVGALAQLTGVSPQAALYCLVLGLQNTVLLNGTKNQGHMTADLEAPKIVGQFASEQPTDWADILAKFKKRIGEPKT